MRLANRLDLNKKWISDQIHTIEDNDIVFVLQDRKRHIQQLKEALALRNIEVDVVVSKLYVMFRKKESVK